MIILTIIIGLVVSYYGVFATKLVYKYKNKPAVERVRLFSTTSTALVAGFGLYLLKHVIWNGTDLPLDLGMVFTASIICGLILFFYIYRNEIK